MIAAFFSEPFGKMWGNFPTIPTVFNHPLKKKICLKCLTSHSGIDSSDGIIAMLTNPCTGQTVEYNPGNFKRRHLFKFMELLQGLPDKTDLERMISYEEFPHLKGVDTDMMSELDIMLYQHARDFEIKMVQRIRKWMRTENDFDKTW